jgi:hypothetical protein
MKVPINELSPELPEFGGLAWQMPVPEGACNAGNLLLDTTQVGLVTRLAGLGGVIVRGYQGDTSEYTVNATSVTGMLRDGTASGTASVSVSKAKTEKSELISQDDESPLRDYNWPVATVDMNRSEIASRIADKRRKGASAEGAWAGELNRSLRRGIVTAAASNLVPEQGADILNTGIVVGAFFIAGGGEGLVTPAAGYAIVFHSLVFTANSLANRLLTGKAMMERKRWSVFPFGVQPDRLALTALAASAKPMVTKQRSSRCR